MLKRLFVYLIATLLVTAMPAAALAADASGSSSILSDTIIGALTNSLPSSGGFSISGNIYGFGSGTVGIDVYHIPGQFPQINFKNQIDMQPGNGNLLLAPVLNGATQLLQSIIPTAPAVQGNDLNTLNGILEQLKQQYISNPGAQAEILKVFTDALQSCQSNQGESKKILSDLIYMNPSNPDYYKQLGDFLGKIGDTGLKVWCNGSQLDLDTNPVIKQGRTLVPIGQIVQALGATADWDPATQQVTIAKDGNTIVLKPGQVTATINGQPVQLNLPAEINNSRLMVPLRFIAQSLNADVDYFSNGGIISVNQ